MTTKLAIPAEALNRIEQLIKDHNARSQFVGMLTVVLPAIVAAELERMADQIDRGPTFPVPPSVISKLVRERAEDVRQIVVEEQR